MKAEVLTPELLDLMEHEKGIEQGVANVGWHLAQIKDGRKYHAAGFKTFEAYCTERWNISRSYAFRQIKAAEVARALPNGNLTESQARELRKVPEAERAAVLDKAKANGKVTATSIKAAATKTKPKSAEHPAPFSDDILRVIASHVAGAGVVLDPFAGVGNVHRLRGLAGVERTIGVELEPEWASKHPDTICADARKITATLIKAKRVDAIVTSPTYGNRMADHHTATDDSTRNTYRHSLGHELSDGNSGAMQWGEDYRKLHKMVWRKCADVLASDGKFVINVKDHIRAGEQQHVVAWHVDYLCRVLGLALVAEHSVLTRGLAVGDNADKRVPFERVFVFVKD